VAHDGRGTDILAYWPLWAIMRMWFLAYMGVRVTGHERVPTQGPVLLCGNHRSVWDPILVGAMVRRRAWYIAKAELLRYPLLGPILRMVGAYPVRRHAVDRPALRRSLEVLDRQGALVLFPEGTRSRTGEMGRAEPGAALLAMRTGAAIVPVGIRGGYGFRGGLEVRFGEPIRLGETAERLRSRELSAIVESQIMGEVARLAGATYPEDRVGCTPAPEPSAACGHRAGGS
jgi:1-acyl-sn-glycerol-3-phosphate acyltransferase